jgi:HSP90 family molecular chaperone
VYVRELLQNAVDAITARRQIDPSFDADGAAEAMDLAARLAAAAEEGRVDLSDLGRRARRLLATTTSST